MSATHPIGDFCQDTVDVVDFEDEDAHCDGMYMWQLLDEDRRARVKYKPPVSRGHSGMPQLELCEFSNAIGELLYRPGGSLTINDGFRRWGMLHTVLTCNLFIRYTT